MTSNQINVLGQAKTRFICLFALNADKCLWHPYEQPLKSRPVCGIKLGSWGSHVTPLALNCWIVFVIDYATHFYAGPQYVLAQYILSACLVINWYFMEAFNLLSIVVRRPWHKSIKIQINCRPLNFTEMINETFATSFGLFPYFYLNFSTETAYFFYLYFSICIMLIRV